MTVGLQQHQKLQNRFPTAESTSFTQTILVLDISFILFSINCNYDEQFFLYNRLDIHVYQVLFVKKMYIFILGEFSLVRQTYQSF